MKREFAILTILAALSTTSFAVTVDNSNPNSTRVSCNSGDSLDQCIAALDPALQNVLRTGSARWKGGYLIFKSGNKISAFSNGFLGDFDGAVVSALSINNRNYSTATPLISDGRIDVTAGGLYISISTTVMALPQRQSTTICINGDCETQQN